MCKILKGTFEISHKIWTPATEKHAFCLLWYFRVLYDIFELWRLSETSPCKSLEDGISVEFIYTDPILHETQWLE